MCTRTPTARLIEALRGRTLDAILLDLYDGQQLSQEQVAAELGVSRWTVMKWMAAYRIPTRDRRRVA